MHINWWTLTFQTVNVLILIWLLGRFFFRPLAEIVAKRQHETAKLLADAAAAQRDADNARAGAAKMRAEFAAERDRLVGEARQAALTEKSALLAKFNEDIVRQRGEAEAQIARERLAAERALNARAGELSIEIARRLLGRLAPNVAFAAFRASLRDELSALPAEARRSLAAADAAHPIEVATAKTLAEDEANEMRRTLREAIGGEPPVAFRTDPKLVAGLELRSRNVVLSNNWRADLEAIGRELIHG